MTRAWKRLGIMIGAFGLAACGGQSTLSEVPQGDGGVACALDSDGGTCFDADGGVGDGRDDDVVEVDCCVPLNGAEERLCDELYNDELPEGVKVVDTCAPATCESLSRTQQYLCELEQEDAREQREAREDEEEEEEEQQGEEEEQPSEGDFEDLLNDLLGGFLGGGGEEEEEESDPFADLLGDLLGGGGDGGDVLGDLLGGLLGGDSGGGFDLGSLFGDLLGGGGEGGLGDLFGGFGGPQGDGDED